MMDINLYEVTDIEEADYGCEECMAGPRALVTLKGCDGSISSIEITEDWISFTGIDIGKTVTLSGDGKYRPVIKVAAAIICAEEKIFATQRGYGKYKDKWEFPGGKIEPGETAEKALVREIKEELDTEILVGKNICTIEYDYPEFHLSMDCFLAEITGGKLTLNEHEAARWLTKDTLDSVDWLPADLSLIETLRSLLKGNSKN